jgi:hypothetical protein
MFANDQADENLGGGGGLNLGRAGAVLPQGARRSDDLEDVDDSVQAYTGTGFNDYDGDYDITDCFSMKKFFSAAMVVVLLALLLVHMIL